jgi:hypothetical protein
MASGKCAHSQERTLAVSQYSLFDLINTKSTNALPVVFNYILECVSFWSRLTLVLRFQTFV